MLNTGLSHSAFDYALVQSIASDKNIGRSMLIADIGTALYLPVAKSQGLRAGSREIIEKTIDSTYADSICSQLPKNWRFVNTGNPSNDNTQIINQLLESPALENAINLVSLKNISSTLASSAKKYGLITVLVYQDPRSIETTEQLVAVLKKAELPFSLVGLDWDRNTTKTSLLSRTLKKKIKLVMATPKIKRAWLSENIKELTKLYK